MARNDDFYCGYRPLPPGLATFVRARIIVVFAIVLTAAILIGAAQRDPGDGAYHASDITSIEGTLLAKPYPMVVQSAPDGACSIILLCEQGKFGAQARVASLDAREVTARGALISRLGMQMLELLAEPAAVARRPLAPAPPIRTLADLKPQDLGEHTFRGEIVDPKCFLGVMKPGESKTHRACAALCLMGGLPPVFSPDEATKDPPEFMLLLQSGQAAAPDAFTRFVGQPVNLTGRLSRVGDLHLLDLTSPVAPR